MSEAATRIFYRMHGEWALGGGVWPRRFTAGRPAKADLAGSLRQVHRWIDDWRDGLGAGSITWTRKRTAAGIITCPDAVIFTGPADIAALDPGAWQTWSAVTEVVGSLGQTWPGQSQLALPLLHRISELDPPDRARLIQFCSWIHRHPQSGLFIRQVPVEGVDTKWAEQHIGLVIALLEAMTPGPQPTAEAGPASTDPVSGLQRIGLRTTPRYVNVVLCDPQLRQHVAGARTLALTTDDISSLPAPAVVMIVENKETGYAFPDRPGLMIIHGLGLNILQVARISWIQETHVLYWGDLDAPGFEWLNNLRQYGVAAQSILMSESEINRFAHLAVEGSIAPPKALPELTASERQTYQDIVGDRWGDRFLLEQERLPWALCLQVIDSALGHRQQDAD